MNDHLVRTDAKKRKDVHDEVVRPESNENNARWWYIKQYASQPGSIEIISITNSLFKYIMPTDCGYKGA